MTTPLTGRESPVRYHEDCFELKCGMCGEFWPLTMEFWRPRNGLQRCIACWREYHKLKQRGYNQDRLARAARNTKNRLRYADRRAERNAAAAVWKAANPERVKFLRRRYYQEHREQELAQVAAYKARYGKGAA